MQFHPILMSEADRDKPVQIKDMLADFGFRTREEALARGLHIGAMVVVKGEFVELNEGQRLLSKAFDNRYGVVLGLEVARHFKDIDLPYDLYVGATVQEEVGLRGARLPVTRLILTLPSSLTVLLPVTRLAIRSKRDN